MAEVELLPTVFERGDGLMLFPVIYGEFRSSTVPLLPGSGGSGGTGGAQTGSVALTKTSAGQSQSVCPIWHEMFDAPAGTRPIGITWHENMVVVGDEGRVMNFLNPVSGAVVKTVSLVGVASTTTIGGLASDGEHIWVLQRPSSGNCRMSLRRTVNADPAVAGEEVVGFPLDKSASSYASVALDPTGTSLWLHDSNADEMTQWSLAGTKLSVIDIPTPTLNVVWGLAFDDGGFLWATDGAGTTADPEKLVKLNPATMAVMQTCWLTAGTVTGLMFHDGYFWHTSDIPWSVFRGRLSQILTYEYTVLNDGPVPLIDLELVDDRVGNVELPVIQLDPEESTTVQNVVYEITDADFAAGGVTNTATATATANTTSPNSVSGSDSVTLPVAE